MGRETLSAFTRSAEISATFSRFLSTDCELEL